MNAMNTAEWMNTLAVGDKVFVSGGSGSARGTVRYVVKVTKAQVMVGLTAETLASSALAFWKKNGTEVGSSAAYRSCYLHPLTEERVENMRSEKAKREQAAVIRDMFDTGMWKNFSEEEAAPVVEAIKAAMAQHRAATAKSIHVAEQTSIINNAEWSRKYGEPTPTFVLFSKDGDTQMYLEAPESGVIRNADSRETATQMTSAVAREFVENGYFVEVA